MRVSVEVLREIIRPRAPEETRGGACDYLDLNSEGTPKEGGSSLMPNHFSNDAA